MKFVYGTGVLIALITFGAFFVSGCPALEKAQAIYEARAQQADDAYNAWTKAIDELGKAKEQFDDFKGEWNALDNRITNAEAKLKAAQDTGDPDIIKAAQAEAERARNDLIALQDRGKLVIDNLKNASEYADTAEQTYKATENIVKAAKKDFEDAKSASDYLGTILGWVKTLGLTILTGGAGAGAAGALTARKKNGQIAAVEEERDTLGSALATTFSNAKKTLSNEDLARLKKAQADAMSEAEKMAAKLAGVR